MNATTRNPDLDPCKVKMDRITHTASANRIAWVGLQVVVTLRNGETRRCEHRSGHRAKPAAVKCATSLVARLNREAGTTTAAVEAGKR